MLRKLPLFRAVSFVLRPSTYPFVIFVLVTTDYCLIVALVPSTLEMCACVCVEGRRGEMGGEGRGKMGTVCFLAL